MLFKKKNNIYLDYASATPVNRSVLKLINKIEKKYFANASAIHEKGVLARRMIEQSRSNIAKSLNAHSDEIIFTGSGTESNALAIHGTVNYFLEKFKDRKIIPHIITSTIEHPSVIENVKLLERKGLVEATYVPVLENGLIDLKFLKESIRVNTALVSVMYANNEIGTIQPIEEIAKIIRKYKKDRSAFKSEVNLYPILHTDACQAMNYLFTENIEKLGVDLMTFNSSKIYGPKGIGVLVKRRNVNIEAIYSGGGQEKGYRSGTESVSLVCALGEALKITNKIKSKESLRLTKLRDYGFKRILDLTKKYPFEITINGDKKERLPNNMNISIIGLPSELVVIELSALGVFVSEKSACKSEDDKSSYVIKAIRSDGDGAEGSTRITLGRLTKRTDIDKLVEAFSAIFEKYKDWK